MSGIKSGINNTQNGVNIGEYTIKKKKESGCC